ncbi:MAG: bifunctional DNA-formamidopyrimidine glycosylase/DNA-(apurinic or apyrimidinic site) lyase [Anaerolineae bacterium]|jgi:formamidopyrimidine-DNA glycosylase
MPELPEVETVTRSLREHLDGRTIAGATVTWRRTVARPAVEEFVNQVIGRRIRSVGRRGKYVVIELERGCLLVHLKMSGQLQVVPAGEPLDGHVRVILDLDDGQQLRFRDTRKFGRIYLVKDPQEVTGSLGPEPLDKEFTLADFRRLLARRTGRLKPLLLNQHFLAGLGNIYADEALFVAKLHPLRKADSLAPDEQARLYDAIRSVLGGAVAARGTTLSDGGYADASGQPGSYQERLAVYGRSGQPCLRCGTPVERIVLGGRSAHYCPNCQVT